MFTSTPLSLINLWVTPLLVFRNKLGVSLCLQAVVGKGCCLYAAINVQGHPASVSTPRMESNAVVKQSPGTKHSLKDLRFCNVKKLGLESSLIPIVRVLGLNLSPHVLCGSGLPEMKGFRSEITRHFCPVSLVRGRKASPDLRGVGWGEICASAS